MRESVAQGSGHYKIKMGHFRDLVPLFQNESKCKTFHMKMSLICMKMNLKECRGMIPPPLPPSQSKLLRGSQIFYFMLPAFATRKSSKGWGGGGAENVLAAPLTHPTLLLPLIEAIIIIMPGLQEQFSWNNFYVKNLIGSLDSTANICQ